LSDLGKITFLKGSERFKGANDQNIGLQIPLSNTIKELEEFQRNISISLEDVYNNERQESKNFIPMAKFSLIFSNSYYGLVQPPINPYPQFNNNLYYVNQLTYKQIELQNPNDTIAWAGQPQYHEFAFIRTDYNVTGYTIGPNLHYVPSPKDASKLNWSFYVSYCFSSSTSTTMNYDINNFLAGDGIPFTASKTLLNGSPVWSFVCPVQHGVSNGESVEIKLFNDTSIYTYDVYSLGNGTQDSNLYVFNLYDYGIFNSLTKISGTFKRIVNSSFPEESKSKYYVRKHKILQTPSNSVLTFAGFENNAFRTVRQFESPQLTPNNVGRVSLREDSQSYNLSFKDYVDITNLYDNLNRPVSEIFFTIINRGRFGWFNKPNGNTNFALKQGWEFNLGPQLNPWWEKTNQNSNTNITTNSFTNGSPIFYYNSEYSVGDIMDGDFCEWNNFTQTERVISEYYHKFTFNPEVFSIGGDVNNQLGYYYKPHNKFQLSVFSSYIEESDGEVIANLPNYAYYKQASQEFIWRDQYPYGFIDENGLGVDYPFLNGKHYPYENFIFRIIPEGSNLSELTNQVSDPIIDGCE